MLDENAMRNFEFIESVECISVRGRLFKQSKEWEKIGASNFIIDVISDGFKIPFVTLPPPKYSDNNCSALKERKFVNEELY